MNHLNLRGNRRLQITRLPGQKCRAGGQTIRKARYAAEALQMRFIQMRFPIHIAAMQGNDQEILFLFPTRILQ